MLCLTKARKRILARVWKFWKKNYGYACEPKSSFHPDLILEFFFLICPQSAFYPWSAVCILPSVCILAPVGSLRFTLTVSCLEFFPDLSCKCVTLNLRDISVTVGVPFEFFGWAVRHFTVNRSRRSSKVDFLSFDFKPPAERGRYVRFIRLFSLCSLPHLCKEGYPLLWTCLCINLCSHYVFIFWIIYFVFAVALSSFISSFYYVRVIYAIMSPRV